MAPLEADMVRLGEVRCLYSVRLWSVRVVVLILYSRAGYSSGGGYGGGAGGGYGLESGGGYGGGGFMASQSPSVDKKVSFIVHLFVFIILHLCAISYQVCCSCTKYLSCSIYPLVERSCKSSEQFEVFLKMLCRIL